MATTTTTAINLQKEPPLRKRIKILDRSRSDSMSSLSTLPSSEMKALPLSDTKLKTVDSGDEMPSPPLTDDDSSESSDDGHRSTEQEQQGPPPKLHATSKPQRPVVSTEDLPNYREHKERSPMSPNSRAWYEFDLAVVVALVSPVGNWLTGTDHIKNLLLIVLLIFYLHQIIEIPWTLYQNSRPRRKPSHIAVDEPSPETRYAQLAASELQKFEMFFLFLTFASPIIGAMFLRYATELLLGPDAVSWFSTGLFVLATGMRPWSHFVERVSQRTSELHNVVHYPPPTHTVAMEAHEALEKRVALLEKALEKVKVKVSHTTEDVYEYVDDAVDAVEHAMRKQERKWDRYEGKVKAVEQTVVQLSTQNSRTATPETNFRWALMTDIDALRVYLRSFVVHIMPNWLVSSRSSSTFLLKAPLPKGRIISQRPISGQSSPSQPSPPLETILEEDPVYREMRKSPTVAVLARPYYVTSALVYRIGYIATLPIRAVLRMVFRRY
ncbi:hypothetical protein BDN70DRAFT_920097 [Pholiota conissans]|uniref:Uncharacterized protein n=1 Tax=Pholiota conissans TaxID=109636 RepID=A0A9P5Z404_9AGAR|nr:hypothetical protein BDN70DRAFT_920097 [Pholiota conissans]